MGLAALGAGGRRFESFCPDKLKMRELQGFVTPIFLLFLIKQDTKRTRIFKNISIIFLYLFVNPLPNRTPILYPRYSTCVKECYF